MLKNPECSELPLIISSDASQDKVTAHQIYKIRSYIDSIKGFKEVIPFYADKPTKGDIIDYTFHYIFENYDAVIFSEDDNIFAPNFLKYMIKGLKKYEKHPKVYSVSGFSHSVFYEISKDLESETYFTQRFNPWGFASWVEKMKNRDNMGINEIRKLLADKQFTKRLNAVGIDRLPQLKQIIRSNKEIPYDYKTGIYMIKNDMYSVVPYFTKSFNTGNDGTGLRSAKNDRFTSIDLSFLGHPQEFNFHDNIDGHINNFFHYDFFNTPFNRFKILLMRLGVYSFAYKFKHIYRIL